MAKRKDDVSFSFKKSIKKKEEEAAPETTEGGEATGDAAAADPFASGGDASSSDPFASTSTDTSSDPFAASSDPFATPTDASSDPFASATPDASADPFATPTDVPADAPAEGSADAPAEEPAAEAPAKKTPQVKQQKQFRILVLGDFSGRTNKQLMETGDAISGRKVSAIDSDSFDKVVAKLKPEIKLPLSETAAVTLKFSKLEDFHPDGLIGQMEGLQGLLKLREQLKNPKTFKDAAAAVRKLTGEKKKAPAKPAAGKGGGGSEFEQLLNQPFKAKGATNATADALIANLVAGYEVPEADPDAARLTAFVEDALSAGLRAILRHPAYRAIETSWRGTEFLTSRLNTDEELKIGVFDLSKEELAGDLQAAATVQKSGIYQILVEQTKVPGAFPYSLVIANYTFEQDPKDIALLAKIAALMHEAGIPFVAGATPRVAGFPSFNKFPDSGKWQPPADVAMWDKIRSHKLAAHIGLTAPRFLLRMPYGPKTDAIDAFGFDEMPGNPVHEQYLWANGAFAVGYCIGQAFLDEGWEFEPGTDVTDLPCHMAVVDGDKEMTPCAEGWLSDRIGDVLHNLGLIPLLSVRNAAAVKVAGVHSIAKPAKALAASWAKG